MNCANCGKSGHTAMDCIQVKRVEGLSDSSLREEFVSGMIREPNLMRGRYDLISPIGMHYLAIVCGYEGIQFRTIERLAIHYERGSLKYAPRNWELGGYISRYLNSALRHLQQYITGCRAEDHLSAIMWNCFCIIHTHVCVQDGLLSSDLLDLPGYRVELPKAASNDMISNNYKSFSSLLRFMINPMDIMSVAYAAKYAMLVMEEDIENESRL